MKRLLILFSCTLTSLLLFTACKNTASGFGKDLENTGEKIQEKMD